MSTTTVLPLASLVPAGYLRLLPLLVLGLVVLGVLAYLVGRSRGSSSADPGTRADRDSSDRWATRRDVSNLVVDDDQVDRAALGRLGKQLLAMPPLHSLAVIAPTGMGKTARYVIPTVLRWQGAALVTSVKGDALALTIDHRETQGPVWVFDPTGASGRESCRWSPLSTADTYGGALKAAAWLCDSSKVEKGTSNEQHLWDTQGERLLAPLLFAAARTGKTMEDVTDWIEFRREGEVEAILTQLGDRDALGSWVAVNAKSDRTTSSVYFTAEKILHVFAHPQMRESLTPTADEPSFDPDEFLTRGGTLYVVAPEEDQELFTPIFESLVNSVVRAVQRRSAAQGGLPIEPRLLLMLDEAANCAPLRRLGKIASAGRGQGIQLISAWQDSSQLDAIYGASVSRTILANHSGRLMLPGVTDVETLEGMSKLLGPRSVQRTGESVGSDGRVSSSKSWQTEPLAPLDYIRELDTGEALVVVSRYKPMRLRTVAWYEDTDLRARIDPEVATAYDATFAAPGKARRRWRRAAV